MSSIKQHRGLMKITLIAAALGCAFATLPASAESFTDMARVTGVRPVTERVPVNRQECWNEQRSTYEERTVTRQDTGAPIGAGTVIGAIAGGVIGHQFGSSSGGRDRGTAAGAIIGGLVGNQVDRQNAAENAPPPVTEAQPVVREVQRCRTIQEVREVPAGYDVRYRYGNREFVTRMPFDPGPHVQVAVDVQPVQPAPSAPPPGYPQQQPYPQQPYPQPAPPVYHH
jgi:uncharacterized protein YcfJ